MLKIILIGSFANLFDFIPQLQKILKRFRFSPRVTQKGGGVEGAHKKNTAFVDKFAVLRCHFKFRRNQPLGGNTPEADDNLGPHQPYLLPQPVDTGLLLSGQGVSVLRGAALNYVRYVDVLFAVKVNAGKEFIKQLSGSADKRFTAEVLLLAGALTDKQHLSIFYADADNNVVAGFAELAFFAFHAVVLECLPVINHIFHPFPIIKT